MELEQTNVDFDDHQGESVAKQNTGENMKGYLNKDYLDLLNATIEGAAGNTPHGSADLDPSYIGPSYWTSEEKAAFFQGLAIKGRDDLPGISSVVRTKSQVEVRSYLVALENGCSGDQIASPDSYSTSSTLAAYEMGDRCERATGLTAEVLERYVLRRDTEREKRNFGKLWLIDDEMAAQIELHQQQKSRAAAIDDENQVVGTSDDSNTESESQNEGIDIQSDAKIDAFEDPGRLHTVSSADLLKPEAFLKLSRSLFMNNAVDAEANWSQLGAEDGEPTPPAMFRSAFDSFATIAINLTHWIVRAVMFQAVSRLRAKDDQNPTAIVTTEDVRTAIDFLNLSYDWKKYWAGVARRCSVEVYSASDKYRGSRAGTRNGRLLSYDEVETELGFLASKIPRDLKSGREGIKRESSTSIASDEMDEMSEQGSESSEDLDEEQSDVESSDRSVGMAKRKRSASISSGENEDQQLNNVDEQASRAEERRLMKMLRYAVSPSPEPRAVGNKSEKSSNPKKRIKSDQQNDLRSRTDYITAWEHQRMAMEMERDEEYD
jgi:RNA polymerase I-specific transcription initiation factor RRN5